MTDADFAGLGQLRSTAQVLRAILGVTTDEEAAQRPAEGRWSVREVMGHLGHVEKLGFRDRITHMVEEENPPLAPYDPDVYATGGGYAGRTLQEALDEFESQRAESMRLLDGIPAEAMDRVGIHGELGPVSVPNLLHEWALHDLGHVRQIAEIVRALKYYPHIGAWRDQYTVNP